MTMKLRLVQRAALIARVSPRLTSTIQAGTGIAVLLSGGVYTISYDIASLTEKTSISAAERDNLFFTVWDSDNSYFRKVDIDTLLTAISAGLDPTLVSIAGLSPGADQAIYFTASDTAALFTLTTQARALLDDATAAAMRGTLEFVTSTTDNGIPRFDGTAGSTQASLWLIDDSGNLCPITTDTGALGTSSLMVSDAFFASGAVINFNNGDVTLTHSADVLTLAGGVLVLPSAGLQVGSSVPFSDAAGTLTLQNVDAIDATTEATIEAAIDTLANLTSIQSQTVTISGGPVTLNDWFDQSVKTTATPQFASINLGHASDTTITRVSAGVIAVEGSNVLLASGLGSVTQAWDANLDQIAALTPTDGNIIVGDGAAWVAESGATARTSLGVGTGDSPEFTAVNIGHATDTTLTRVSAGVAAIEGSNILLASGLGSITQAYNARLADIAGITYAQGDVLYHDGSNIVKLAAGTAGRFLRTAGTGANPSWSDIPGTNRLINPAFHFDQRNAGASTAISDDAYCFDRYYVLTQTAAINVSRLSDPENGYIYALRMTQNQAAAQRMGLAQIIEGINCKDLRGGSGVFVPRVRISNSQAIRYAILGWTGTEDTVTSDVVNDWTSGTYTAGNFFPASSVSVLVVGAQTPSANTWTSLSAITASLGTTFTNIIIFVWTEGTAAQNVTLDFDFWQFEEGSMPSAFEFRNDLIEHHYCQRYFQKSSPADTAVGAAANYGSLGTMIALDASNLWQPYHVPVEMRTTPTLTLYSNTTLSSGVVREVVTNNDKTVASVDHISTLGFTGITSAAAFTAGRMYDFQWVLSAEL